MKCPMEPKIIYIHSQFRVRCEVSKGYCDQYPSPPKMLLQRATRKLAFEMAVGNIDSYDFFNERLVKTWKLFRESKAPENDILAVTLATGCPPLKGVTVRSNRNNPQVAAHVSISASADEVIAWRPELLKYYISTKIRGFAPDRLINTAELYGLWYLASQGAAIHEVPIHFLRPLSQPTTALTCQAFPHMGIVALYCYKIAVLQSETSQLKVLKTCANMAKKELGADNFLLLKKDIISKLESAFRGVERFGLDLPVVIIGAIKQPKSKKVTQALKQKVKEESISSYDDFKDKFGSYITISTSPDHMTASLSLDRRLYLDFPDIKIDWLRSILSEQGYKVPQESLTQLESSLKNRLSVEDFNFAFGGPAQDADHPFLHPLHLDVSPIDDREKIDFRKQSQHNIVRKGQPFAEIRYHTPGVDGFTVKGQTLPYKVLNTLSYTYDEALIVQNDHQFIALHDGIPKIDKNHLSLKKVLIHKGSVNLSTGDIDFSGEVIIKGDVEQGAMVKAQGFVQIYGSVFGGSLDIQGDLSIKQGIKSSSLLGIKVSGDMEAGYIENSLIQVGGSLRVKKGIIGGQILVGKDLHIEDQRGQIYASSLYVQNEIQCMDLGKTQGKKTDIYLGISLKESKGLLKVEKRIKYFGDLLTEAQAHDKSKKGKIKEAEASTKRIKKLMRIEKNLRSRFFYLTKKIERNSQSICRVHGILSANCYFHFNGQDIKVPTELSKVQIRSKSQGQTARDYFSPLLDEKDSA